MIKPIIVTLLCLLPAGAVVNAQMDPYFSTISHPLPRDTLMVMLLSGFQSARTSQTSSSIACFGSGPRVPAKKKTVQKYRLTGCENGR
jgi:hypothetical protein